jgi:hypothetical protein
VAKICDKVAIQQFTVILKRSDTRTSSQYSYRFLDSDAANTLVKVHPALDLRPICIIEKVGVKNYIPIRSKGLA